MMDLVTINLLMADVYYTVLHLHSQITFPLALGCSF